MYSWRDYDTTTVPMESPSQGGEEQSHKNFRTLGMTTKRFAIDRLSQPHSCFTRIGLPSHSKHNRIAQLTSKTKFVRITTATQKRNEMYYLQNSSILLLQLFDNVIYFTI